MYIIITIKKKCCIVLYIVTICKYYRILAFFICCFFFYIYLQFTFLAVHCAAVTSEFPSVGLNKFYVYACLVSTLGIKCISSFYT